MPDGYPPSEFGGKTDHLGFEPLPHSLTARERLRHGYLTGDETLARASTAQPLRENMRGLLPFEEQKALREAEGALDKGEVWKEMLEGAEET